MIRRARLNECATLSALALRSKAVWGYSPDFLARCVAELTVTESHFPHIFVSEASDAIAGFYALGAAEPARPELEFMFVAPDYLRRGHGRALLEHARRYAREVLGATVIDITGDPNADAFYRAAGARHIGERPSEIVAGRMLPAYELDC